jgi:hypothetical protein
MFLVEIKLIRNNICFYRIIRLQKDGNHTTEGAPFPNKTAKLQKFHQLTQIGLRGKSMGKLKRQQEQA